MDLVCRLSKHPVALLGRPIESRNEMNLLFKILVGKLIQKDQKTAQLQLSEITNYKVCTRICGSPIAISALRRKWTRDIHRQVVMLLYGKLFVSSQ